MNIELKGLSGLLIGGPIVGAIFLLMAAVFGGIGLVCMAPLIFLVAALRWAIGL